MAGDIASQNRRLMTENPLQSLMGGRGVDAAVALYQTSGVLNGERIAPIPQTNALGLTESIENLAESGAISLLRNRSSLSPQAASARNKTVSARSGASELKDTTSASSDADEPDAIVKRIASLLDAFDDGGEMGGGGGGGGGSDAGQQQNQRQQAQTAHISGIAGSSTRQSAAFMDRLNVIRSKALDTLIAQPNINQGQLIEVVIDDVRQALAELSSDFVQQLLALSSVRSHFSNEDIFGAALDVLQQEYDRFDVGGFINQAVTDTYAAIDAKHAARATMETDPSATRDVQRRSLRESEGRLDEVIAKLETAHPHMPLRNIIANYMVASGHELSGSDGANIDKDYLHSLLREIAALKMLNSVYDQTLDLLDRTNLKESSALSAVNIMRTMLSFVSQPKPNVDESISRFNSILPRNQMSLDERLLLSTNLDDMHCNLPDGVFPGLTLREQHDARAVQQKTIKTWRHQLAREEVMLSNPMAAAVSRQKQTLASLFNPNALGGNASTRAA